MARILVSPLDWGLGHISRTTPVIQALLDLGHEPMIGIAASLQSIIEERFPELEIIRFPAFAPDYQRDLGMAAAILTQIPKFRKAFQEEKQLTAQLVDRYAFDYILSDHRYGVYDARCTSYLLAHQLNVQVPFRYAYFKPIGDQLHRRLFSKFDQVLIPDFPDRFLSGKLSDFNIEHKSYIGPVSRFQAKSMVSASNEYDLLAILSGPEPQRSVLEQKLVEQLDGSSLKVCVVRGVEGEWKNAPGYIDYFGRIGAEKLLELSAKSKVILSRSGYSSLMDYYFLGKPAIIIPTPGQTEQEYLAKRCKQNRIFASASQPSFNLMKLMEEVQSYSGFYSQSEHCASETQPLQQRLRPYFS